MSISLDISLVVATYGRYQEVDNLLQSLLIQEGEPLFEVIIIDQNDIIDLKPLVNKYGEHLNIVYFKSNKKGLSRAKNKGIQLSKAPVITFPDDDCKFYPDTIISALGFLKQNEHVDIVYGRIFDWVTNRNIMREWSQSALKLNKYNFHLNYSAVTCFSRKKSLFFDENFGVGSKFGVGEELDYVMKALNDGCSIVYEPSISIWHPEHNIKVMSDEKVQYYALGYGAVFRKNLSFQYGFIFFASLSYQLIQIFKGVITGNVQQVRKRKLAFSARLKGFFSD